MKRLFNKRQRNALRILASNLCEACGQKLDKSFHADHKKPFSKGGETALTNAQALCPNCNLKKGANYDGS